MTWEEVDGHNVSGAQTVLLDERFFHVSDDDDDDELRYLSSSAIRNCQLALAEFDITMRVDDCHDWHDAENIRIVAFAKKLFGAVEYEEDGSWASSSVDFGVLVSLSDEQQAQAGLAAAAVLQDENWLPTKLVAYDVLQGLRPRVSILHHATVSGGLAPTYPCEERAVAAHTLACMGPEAVVEHYEEIIQLAGEAEACESAAWLAVAVLLPEHMLRLEMQGRRPVDDFIEEHREDLWLGIRLTGVRQSVYGDSTNLSESRLFDEIHSVLLAGRSRAREDPGYAAHLTSGPIVADDASRLSTFTMSYPSWSPATHPTYPLSARARAVELFLLGAVWSRTGRGLPLELWLTVVLPHAISRRSLPGGKHIFRESDRYQPLKPPLGPDDLNPEFEGSELPLKLRHQARRLQVAWAVEEARQKRAAREAAYKTSDGFWMTYGPSSEPTKSRVPGLVDHSPPNSWLGKLMPPKRLALDISLTRGAQGKLGFSLDAGNCVERVDPGEAAQRAGLERQDRVVGVNGQRLAPGAKLIDMLPKGGYRSKVILNVMRGEGRLSL